MALTYTPIPRTYQNISKPTFSHPKSSHVLHVPFQFFIPEAEVETASFFCIPLCVNWQLKNSVFKHLFHSFTELFSCCVNFKKIGAQAVICTANDSGLFAISVVTVMVGFAVQKFFISPSFMVSVFYDIFRKAVPTPRFFLVLLWFHFYIKFLSHLEFILMWSVNSKPTCCFNMIS